jgi:2-polyprenyl-3-methyl-5-hydroxy-6-metoxy-1,4-benzoquinol methylase
MENKELYDSLYQGMLEAQHKSLFEAYAWDEWFGSILTAQAMDGKRILELGCGPGHLSNWLQKKGHEVIAADLSEVAIGIAKSRYPDIPFLVLDAQDTGFQGSCFQLVLGIETIEHLPYPSKHLQEVYRILDRDGTYILKTPNKWLDWFFCRILLRRDTSKEHVSLFTHGALKKALVAHGFEPSFIKQEKLFPTQRNKVRMILPPVLAQPTTCILNRILQVLPLSLCPSLICVARKRS